MWVKDLTAVLELTDENARPDVGSAARAGIGPPAACPRPQRGCSLSAIMQA